MCKLPFPSVKVQFGFLLCAFSETVLHGRTGFRCRTFDDFVWAIKNAGRIDPRDCREWATANYSIARISQMYQEYFEKLDAMRSGGWYPVNADRSELNWLVKYDPHIQR